MEKDSYIICEYEVRPPFITTKKTEIRYGIFKIKKESPYASPSYFDPTPIMSSMTEEGILELIKEKIAALQHVAKQKIVRLKNEENS